MKAQCIIPNCRNLAPDAEPFCSKHRDKPKVMPFRIGSLTLSAWRAAPGTIEITQESGEAGHFPIEEVEAVLQAYYTANF